MRPIRHPNSHSLILALVIWLIAIVYPSIVWAGGTNLNLANLMETSTSQIDGQNTIIIAETFAPENKITRAQFTAMVSRALGLVPQESNALFKDVRDDDWYAAYVSAAVKTGIIR
ncbi:MAG: S-layer homology domain-containing protein, partial [Carboxydocellales bacterium]